MLHPDDPENAPPAETLRHLIMGFRTTQLIYVAAKLGIADVLTDGPQDAAALARAVGAHPSALYRLLRALASLGIFEETTEGRFQLTGFAHPLRRDVPGSVRGLALLYGDEWLWHAYGRTVDSVMTGLPAFDLVHGKALFEYLSLHPEAASSFDQAMTGYSEQEAAAILAAYDFSSAAKLVDVGGGQGALLAAILKTYPQAYGILFDRDSVIESARNVMVLAGAAERCATVPGNFFEAVPPGGDVYMLKSILHDWDDERSITLLKNCREVMGCGSRLLVIERVVPEGNEPSEAALFDINMLVVTGGLERTAPEYQKLFEAAEFKLTRIVPTQSPVSIVEGIPMQTNPALEQTHA